MPLILNYLHNCKLGTFQVIYREKLWSLSLEIKWNNTCTFYFGEIYVKSLRQAEMTKRWEIFKDFISLPDNDKVHFVLSEGKSNLIYLQQLQCHDPHFTFFKQPQQSKDITVPSQWGWSTAKCLINHQMLSFEATCFFIMMKQDAQHVATHHNLMGKKETWFTQPFFERANNSSNERMDYNYIYFFSFFLIFCLFCFTQRAEYLTPFLCPVWEKPNKIWKKSQKHLKNNTAQPHSHNPQITILILNPEQTGSELRGNIRAQAMNLNIQQKKELKDLIILPSL